MQRRFSAEPSSHRTSLLLGPDGRDGISPPLALRRPKERGVASMSMLPVIVVPLDEHGRSCLAWE
jgi:hypothetical protein